MKSKVIDDYLLVEVDKVMAVHLFQKGFEIVGIDDAGGIDCIDRTVYDEENGDEREMTFDEVIKAIANYDGDVYMANNIPINFEEIKEHENVIKTRFSVGDMVYALIPDSGTSYTPSMIKNLKVVGIEYQESYNSTRISTEYGSRQTTQELSVKGDATEKRTKYYLADNRYTYTKGYMLYENEVFGSIEELKESL